MRSEGGGIGKSNSGRGAGFYRIKTVKVGDWSADGVRANPLISMLLFRGEPGDTVSPTLSPSVSWCVSP